MESSVSQRNHNLTWAYGLLWKTVYRGWNGHSGKGDWTWTRRTGQRAELGTMYSCEGTRLPGVPGATTCSLRGQAEAQGWPAGSCGVSCPCSDTELHAQWPHPELSLYQTSSLLLLAQTCTSLGLDSAGITSLSESQQHHEVHISAQCVTESCQAWLQLCGIHRHGLGLTSGWLHIHLWNE